MRIEKYFAATMIAVGLCAGSVTSPVAQGYPDHTITIVVPFSAGGGLDGTTRSIGAVLSELIEQTIVVENRDGASGQIGTRHVVEAEPDGYTVLAMNNTMVTNAAMSRRDLELDGSLDPVAMFNQSPVAIAVHPDVPVNSIEELAELLKAEPDKYAYSSCGVGTVMHLVAERFKIVAGVDVVHTPYRGCGPAITDGLGGHVPILFNTIRNVLPHAQSGALRLLAVTTPIDLELDGKSIPVLSDIPGYEDVKGEVWSGLFVPAGTPEEVIQTLNQAVEEAKATDTLVEQFRKSYQDPVTMSPDEMRSYVKNDFERWSQVVEEANLEAQ